MVCIACGSTTLHDSPESLTRKLIDNLSLKNEFFPGSLIVSFDKGTEYHPVIDKTAVVKLYDYINRLNRLEYIIVTGDDKPSQSSINAMIMVCENFENTHENLFGFTETAAPPYTHAIPTSWSERFPDLNKTHLPTFAPSKYWQSQSKVLTNVIINKEESLLEVKEPEPYQNLIKKVLKEFEPDTIIIDTEELRYPPPFLMLPNMA